MHTRDFRLGALRFRIAIAPAGTRFSWLHFDRPTVTAMRVIPLLCFGTIRSVQSVQRFFIVGRLALHLERLRPQAQRSVDAIDINL